MKKNRILFCDCAYTEILEPQTRAVVLHSLQQSGADVTVVNSICSAAVNDRDILVDAAASQELTIIACFERAVRCLFRYAGAELPEQTSFLNFRTQTAKQILDGVGISGRAESRSALSSGSTETAGPADEWVPWYPVIDYDLCVNCKQCMNFCLFGVYKLDEQGKVRVVAPANCKTNCPACARVCPKSAIIFPLYTESPFNGDKVEPGKSSPTGSAASQNTDAGDNKVDLTALIGSAGSIHDLISRRKKPKKRFSLDDADGLPGDKVDSQGCGVDSPGDTVETLKQQLDIPDDVIRSLSPKDIASLCSDKCTNRCNCQRGQREQKESDDKK